MTYTAWSHNLDESGVLRLYLGSRIVSTVSGVSEAQVSDLVAELIYFYNMENELQNELDEMIGDE